MAHTMVHFAALTEDEEAFVFDYHPRGHQSAYHPQLMHGIARVDFPDRPA